MQNCCRSWPVPTARPGYPGQERHGAQVRPVPSRVPHQGRHPGDADRRGDDRLTVRTSASENPARPAAPDRRRRVHDPVYRRAAPDSPRRASELSRSSRPAAPVVRTTRTSTRSSSYPGPRGLCAAPRRRAAGATASGPLRRRDRPARRAAQRLADLGQPRTDAHRLRIAGRVDVHQVVARAADLAPRHSVVNQWDLLRRWASSRSPRPTTRGDGRRARRRPLCTRRGWPAGVRRAHALVVIHVSAGNAFRRWPAPAFEDLVVGLVQRDGQRRVVLTSGRPTPTPRAGLRPRRARGWAIGRAPSSTSESSIWPNSARSWRGPLSTWGRQRAVAHGRHDPRRSWRCSGRRCRSGRNPGATLDGSPRWWTWSCPAARATSACASRGTSVA